MKHLEKDLYLIRQDIIEMWRLVISQVSTAGEAMQSFNSELARKVVLREKKVDAYELKIDNECENLIALNQPVAIDLRFVLAILKINSNLERIADFAYGIAKTLLNNPSLIEDAEAMTDANLQDMIKQVNNMLERVLISFEHENPDESYGIFQEDSEIDAINENAPGIIAEYIKKNPERAYECIQLISVFRKLERIGDHCSNIAEEIFFYVDAKVLKHSAKKL